MTAKTAAERKADERARMRAQGYVAVTVWAHPDDREAIKNYAARKMRDRPQPSRSASDSASAR